METTTNTGIELYEAFTDKLTEAGIFFEDQNDGVIEIEGDSHFIIADIGLDLDEDEKAEIDFHTTHKDTGNEANEKTIKTSKGGLGFVKKFI